MANRLGVSRSTISRLKLRKSGDPVNEVPQRKKGTGPKKKYTMREVVAVEKAMLKNAHLTSIDLKRIMPRLLRNLSPRTIRRILDVELDRPARVAPEKPYLTEEMKARRVKWSSANLSIVLGSSRRSWRGTQPGP